MQIDGFVFLNDILGDLGFKKTSIGAVTGWIRDDLNKDKHISFGITEILKEKVELNFNIDGIIFDKI